MNDKLRKTLPPTHTSEAYFRRAQGLIPAYTQTLAKGPSQHVDGVMPKYLMRGKGARVWDVDGNEAIDMTMAVGPLVLGYRYPEVDAAIQQQLQQGITFSLMHPLEVEVAELIRDVVPGAEMVRFSKSGADVTSAAVRVARAFTGRERILCCGYHGWHDWYIGSSVKNRGVPRATAALTQTFKYNDIDSLFDRMNDRVAAVIMEPTIFDEPAEGFLREVRRSCDRFGALLIFDEMWTGFRLALGGAQQRYGVRADLACFSKAVANGMPLSVLTGQREIMQLLHDDVFFFTTFGGEALSLAAAKATIELLRDRQVPEYLEATGAVLRDAYNSIAAELGANWTACKGPGCRSIVTFDHPREDPLLLKSLLQQELFRRGVLWSGFHNLSFSHTAADISLVLEAYRGALSVVSQAVTDGSTERLLQGKPVQPVFRKTR